jgi:hypothetical protein
MLCGPGAHHRRPGRAARVEILVHGRVAGGFQDALGGPVRIGAEGDCAQARRQQGRVGDGQVTGHGGTRGGGVRMRGPAELELTAGFEGDGRPTGQWEIGVECRAHPGDVHPDKRLGKVNHETFEFDTHRTDSAGADRPALDEELCGGGVPDLTRGRLGESHHVLIEADRSDNSSG